MSEVRAPLDVAQVGDFTVVDYGGSIAEILIYTTTPAIVDGEETTVPNEIPIIRGSISGIREPINFGVPLPDGTLEVLLEAWVISNTPADQSAAFVAQAVKVKEERKAKNA